MGQSLNVRFGREVALPFSTVEKLAITKVGRWRRKNDILSCGNVEGTL